MTTTDDEAAFPRTIREHPEADLPRRERDRWATETRALVPPADVECPDCRGRKTERWTCKVCGAEPGDDGEVSHGRGCYRIDADGGGSEWPDLAPCHRCSGTGRIPAPLEYRR